MSGIDTAFYTVVTMLAITYGLIASTIVLPDQPATSGGREGAWLRREREQRSAGDASRKMVIARADSEKPPL